MLRINALKVFLLSKAFILMFFLSFAVKAVEQTVNAGGILGPDTIPVFSSGNYVTFGSPTHPQGADATLIVGDGQDLGLSPVLGYSVQSLTTVGTTNLGFVTFLGNSTVAGTMGMPLPLMPLTQSLRYIQGGATGTTVTFNEEVHSQFIQFTADSIMSFNADVQADLDYNTFNGNAVIGPGISFTGNVVPNVLNSGILTLNNGSQYVGNIGNLGGVITAINQINLNADATIAGITTSQNIILDSNKLTQVGPLFFPNNAVLQSSVIDDTHYGKIDATGSAIIFSNGLEVNVQIDNNATFSGAPLQLTTGISDAISAPITANSNKVRITFTGVNPKRTGNIFMFPVIVSALPSDSVAKGAASAFDAGFFGASGDFLAVQKSVTLLNNLEAIGAAQTQFAPIANGGNTFMSFQAVNQFNNLWATNLSNVRRANYSSALFGAPDHFQNNAGALWIDGFQYSANQGILKKIPGYNAKIRGLMAGLQCPASKHWQLGIGGGYAHTIINNKGRQKSGSKIESPEAMIYLGYNFDSWYLYNFFTLALNHYRDFRHIQFADINRVARANYRGQQYSALFSGGYDYFLNSGLTITPLASLQLAKLRMGGYTETGALSLNLVQKSRHCNLMQTGLGLKVGYPIQLGLNTLYTEIHSKWFYNVSNKRVKHTSRFLGGGPEFDTVGAKPFHNQINLGLSSALLTVGHLSLKASYDASFQYHFQSFQGNIHLSYNF